MLASCATASVEAPQSIASQSTDGIARAALGQRVYVDGPQVTPLEVLEDSRCPASTMCVWAGRVRLSVKIDLGSGSQIREIATDDPIQVADGQLSLVEVTPGRQKPDIIEPADYRFGFRFAGGI